MKRFVTVAALLLSACGEVKESKHSPDETDRELTQAEKKIFIDYFQDKVLDPKSLQFRFPKLSKRDSAYKQNYCFFVNSTNAYGGYIGFFPTIATINIANDWTFTVERISPYNSSAVFREAGESLCNGFGYSFRGARE